MWLANQKAQGGMAAPSALTGPVTVAGEPAAVWLEGERRGVEVYAPGGYHWTPDVGQELLVLKTGTGGEGACAVGAKQNRVELQPGDILIETGKASLLLKQNGDIELKGKLFINGGHVHPEFDVPEEEGE